MEYLNFMGDYTYQYMKAIHIVAIVSWFAGLFYLVRLFIYHVEAHEKSEPEKTILANQFAIMEKRLWSAICMPAMIATLISGAWLVIFLRAWDPVASGGWMHIKFLFLLGLFHYHFHLNGIRKRILNQTKKYTSGFLRFYNEVATLYLFAIVFVVVIKDTAHTLYGYAGFVVFMIVLTLLFRKKLAGK